MNYSVEINIYKTMKEIGEIRRFAREYHEHLLRLGNSVHRLSIVQGYEEQRNEAAEYSFVGTLL